MAKQSGLSPKFDPILINDSDALSAGCKKIGKRRKESESRGTVDTGHWRIEPQQNVGVFLLQVRMCWVPTMAGLPFHIIHCLNVILNIIKFAYCVILTQIVNIL